MRIEISTFFLHLKDKFLEYEKNILGTYDFYNGDFVCYNF